MEMTSVNEYFVNFYVTLEWCYCIVSWTMTHGPLVQVASEEHILI